ncbi:MAG: hypothetical protein MJA27_34245 [Pseudanabaenales cyanobacterium]|nr:hypothetical protein [Pseudanabaenales cyanobacterium]
MATGANVQVRLDLTTAEPDFDAEELERLTRNLAKELGDLTENTRLVRASAVPEGSKPGLAGFIWGALQAEISLANLKAFLSYLGERFYGKPLTLEFVANGKNYKLEYCSKQQLEDAVKAIERLAQIN